MAKINVNNNESNESESRETSYIKFISSIPRLCSPTICGTANYKTPKSNRKCKSSSIEWSFNWSIEQMARLNPCDFSNVEEFDNFKEIDEKIASNQLNEENDEFFSQNQIIPSPKTPEMSAKSIQICKTHETPDHKNKDSLVIDCYKTPLNCSKTKHKKKLFEDNEHNNDYYSQKESDSLFSPIYSPNWRNTSLSNRITFLSPICAQNENYLDFEEKEDFETCETSMNTEIASYSNSTCEMLSIESQPQLSNSRSSVHNYFEKDYGNDLEIICNNNNRHKVQKQFLIKTSTPSHL